MICIYIYIYDIWFIYIYIFIKIYLYIVFWGQVSIDYVIKTILCSMSTLDISQNPRSLLDMFPFKSMTISQKRLPSGSFLGSDKTINTYYGFSHCPSCGRIAFRQKRETNNTWKSGRVPITKLILMPQVSISEFLGGGHRTHHQVRSPPRAVLEVC